MSTKLSTNNLFRTFETEKEAAEWINSHSLPEEKRLLWLGFAFGCNYAANQVNKKFILKKKEAASCKRQATSLTQLKGIRFYVS